MPWSPNTYKLDIERRKRNLALPRIYFDSDALIKGLIEVLPQVQSHPRFAKQTSHAVNEIPHAQKILDSWNPEYLKVSMYTLMETLNCGFRKYGLSYEELLPIVRDSISTRFTLIFADFELVGHESSLVRELENQIPDSKIYAKIQAGGMALDEHGKELGRLKWGGTLASGAVLNEWYTGSGEIRDRTKSITEVDSHRITSPKIERELFLRAVDLALSFNIAPKDSMHILYALGNAEYIVTTDSDFIKILNKDTQRFPQGLFPSEVLTRWGDKLDLRE